MLNSLCCGASRGSGAPDPAEPDDAQRGVPHPSHRLIEGEVGPTPFFHELVVLAQAPVQRKNHPNGVIGHLVDAVVRNVRDDDAQFRGRRYVDVVHTDAVS